MEEARIWTLTKRTKRDEYLDDSWEEQAFADDAAGLLGGCVWPPRSYTCSFCRREFRSAQALGGHMNVHRRDRARLKQFFNTTNDENSNHHRCRDHHDPYNNNNPYTSSSAASLSADKFPSPGYTTVNYNPNPNSCSSSTISPSSSRFHTSISQDRSTNTSQKSAVFSCSWPSNDLGHKRKSSCPSPNLEHEKHDQGLTSKGDKHHVKSDLSMGLVVQSRTQTVSFTDADKKEVDQTICLKRRKIDRPSCMILVDRCAHPTSSNVQGQTCGSLEELDLELRLGDRSI